ncbi:MAG: hypothetical protein J6W75_00975 [Bacteroidaceae bacterium]|nr:hypothetical protein [Bacteroidales bacterium]MBP5769922.1 hypothetical protein [Bacteroidaceae bacterium]
MEIKRPTNHRMTRRAAAHDYTQPGIYHITLHVGEGLGHPFGQVVGNLNAPDGSADAPRVALTPLGHLIEHELLHAITAHYPMITIQDHIVMPEHIHCLMVVQDKIISSNGRTLHIGQVIAGFKKGCNRLYWDMTGQAVEFCDGKTVAHTISTIAEGTPFTAAAALAGSVSGGFPAGYKVPSSACSGKHPLFDPGYCDVMPVDAAQLATQRQYITANPRSRLMRQQQHLHPQRGGIATALFPAALRGYLQRECPSHLVTTESLDALQARLLLAPDGSITCDTFGDRALLAHRLLPVVCHRKDASRFAQQQRRSLEEAARGAVLISARIAMGEQAIIDEAMRRGFPVAHITDNGFPDRYHPSAERLDLCAAGRLLLITPWQYHYRPNKEPITVPACKTMNCLAQALARTKDTWWQQP